MSTTTLSGVQQLTDSKTSSSSPLLKWRIRIYMNNNKAPNQASPKTLTPKKIYCQREELKGQTKTAGKTHTHIYTCGHIHIDIFNSTLTSTNDFYWPAIPSQTHTQKTLLYKWYILVLQKNLADITNGFLPKDKKRSHRLNTYLSFSYSERLADYIIYFLW